MARLILVADDSPTIQRRAQGILQGEGFEVETVSNGVAAIKKLPKLQPVLVLADVSMPGKDGYEVCDYVKTSADFRHVPVLLVASDLEPYDEQRGAQVGADGIIKKPFTPHDLIAMVAKFTALGEAPASLPALAETLVTSSPVALPEASPMGSEPDGATGRHEPDFSAPSAGMAFAGPPEIPATPPEPLPDISLQPSLQPPLPVWAQSLPEPLLAAPPEDLLEGSSESLLVPTEPFPGLALDGTPEPTPEPRLEVATEPTPTAAESISGTGLEATPEPTLVAPEPTPEPIPETAPEPALVSPEPISESAVEPTPEPTLVAPEPTPEPIPEAAPEPALVSPELISETAMEPTLEPALVTPGPAPEPVPEAAPEPVLVSPEVISETAMEPTLEPVLVTPGPTPEPIPEAAPEPALVSPEVISETAMEPTLEPVLVTPGPTPEPIPEAAPEPVLVSPESISETAVEPTPEPTVIAAEPTPEPIPEAAPEPVLVSPESISETAVEPTSELATVVSEPPVAESGVPCAPVSVTETVHPPAEAAPEAPSALPAEELLLPIVEGQQPKPMAATSLDSFSLAEAAEGQVYIAPPEAEAAPSLEAGVVQPGEAPAGPPSGVDREWVYVVVRKVVMKMAPPVLPPELVEELIRALTEEITAELNSESSQPY